MIAGALLLAVAAVALHWAVSSAPDVDVDVLDDGLPAEDVPPQAWVNPCRVGRDRPCGVPLTIDLPRDATPWVLADGAVLVLDPSGHLRLHEAHDRVRWSTGPLLPPSTAPPAMVAVDDLVVVATAGIAVAVDAVDGALRWRTAWADEVSADAATHAAIAPPRSVTMAVGSLAVVLDLASGEVVASWDRPDHRLVPLPDGILTLTEGQVSLVGPTPGDEPRWRRPLPDTDALRGPTAALDDPRASRAPLRHPQPRDPVSIGHFRQVVLDPATGRVLHGDDAHVDASLVLGDRVVISRLPDPDAASSATVRTVVATSPEGEVLWQREVADQCCPMRLLATTDGDVVVSTRHRGGHPALVLDADTGEVVQPLPPPLEAVTGGPRLPLAAVTDELAIWIVSNRLVAVDRSDGRERWEVIGDAASPATLRSLDPLVVVARHQVVRID